MISEFGLNVTAMRIVDENWESVAPYLLHYYNLIPKDEQANVTEKIRQYYLGDKPIERQTLKKLIQMVGDRTYCVGSLKAANAMANRGPVWYYRYSYRAATSTADSNFKSRQNFGNLI